MILRIQPDDPGIERIEDRSNPFLPVLIVAVLTFLLLFLPSIVRGTQDRKRA